MIDLEDVGAIVSAHAEPEAAVRALIQAALDAGGRDNITVIVIAVEAR
jgi:protein phosphatase